MAGDHSNVMIFIHLITKEKTSPGAELEHCCEGERTRKGIPGISYRQVTGAKAFMVGRGVAPPASQAQPCLYSGSQPTPTLESCCAHTLSYHIKSAHTTGGQ